jgi:hypothetical protein
VLALENVDMSQIAKWMADLRLPGYNSKCLKELGLCKKKETHKGILGILIHVF